MSLVSGFINQRIEIYSASNIPNEYGGVDPGNTLYWATNAKVKQLRSSRTLEANQSPLLAVFSFEVRYRNDKEIQNNMLLKWRGSFFIIQGYIPDVVYQTYVKFDAIAKNSGALVSGTQETT